MDLHDFFKQQVMSLAQAEEWTKKTGYNVFDATKFWPETDFPPINVGEFVLNRNPDNYFAEVEQLAFAPSTLIPGVIPSPDPILQTRLFIYGDTQCYVRCCHSSSMVADRDVFVNFFSASESTCSNYRQINPFVQYLTSVSSIPVRLYKWYNSWILCYVDKILTERDGFMTFDNQAGQENYNSTLKPHKYALYPKTHQEFIGKTANYLSVLVKRQHLLSYHLLFFLKQLLYY